MNNQENVWKIGKWAGIALTAFLVIITVREIMALKYVGGQVAMTGMITVTGKGEAISIPDIATFSFTITENAKTVKEAQDKIAEKMNKALKSVKDEGVAEKDIKTISYSINPRYEYEYSICTSYACPGKNVQKGYDVSQSIEVKVRDLEKAGKIFDSIGDAGITNVNGLTFEIDNIDKIKAQAREEAIKNAKEEAKKIAEELDVKLVKITGYYDMNNESYPMYAREAMSSDIGIMKASATTIPKGEQIIKSSISITYEIK